EQYGIEYRGRKLGSGREAWWAVQVWDGKGIASEWSAPAHFMTGLLSPSDWKADWIGYDVPDPVDPMARPFEGSSWIWTASGKKDPTFTRAFTLNGVPRAATMVLTADDQFTLWVNGRQAAKSDGKTDAWRRTVRVDLKPFLRNGENELRVEAVNTEGGGAGLIGQLFVVGSDGSRTNIATDSLWKEGSTPSGVVGQYGVAPWGKFADGIVVRPSTLYRKNFSVRPGLRRAVAHVTGLGLVDLYLNGSRVTEDLFTPGWTNYKKRVYARTFDVTNRLKGGANAVGAELGDGWYSGYVGYGRQRSHYGERPRVRVQLDLEYTDGRRETVGTSGDWLASVGMTRAQDFLWGEEADGRLRRNWSTGRFFASRATLAKVDRSITTPIEPFPGVPVREYARLAPISIKKAKEGYILDFGQNLAGFAHLRSKGRAGSRVEMRFVEVLNPDGTPYTANLRSARATDAYIFAGKGIEEWEPRFTFHGFRYVHVLGLDHAPTKDEITAVAITSDTPEVGTIETSDAMLNKLAKNAWWTQKMNFIDVPTDCPQRDERLGWTGDAQAYIRTAATYSDVQAFFDKWLVALDDDQRADGQYPMVAPQIVAGDDGGPAWADAGVICPTTIYDVYGDKRLLARHYPQMKKFVEFCVKRSGEDLLPPKQTYHIFGDWLSINANTPPDVIYEAYFALSTRLLARSARILGHREDAEKYEQLYRDIRTAFNKAYVTEAGVVAGDTQTAYVLALAFDLLEPAMAKKAAARLVANIESRGWHLSTGFVGTRDLMQVLSKIGRNDVAFRLLHNTTFPSWGFEIKNGATTIWERWDGWTPERGFQDPGMNSFAHYAYGAVMGWVYATIGGIDHLTPGFGTVKIAPQIDPKLTWAKTTYDSIRGPIKTEWRKANGKLTLTVEIPPNAKAEISVPGEGFVRRVGSGTYAFVTKV
ncbi:rhamnosidase, partial [bacterium]